MPRPRNLKQRLQRRPIRTNRRIEIKPARLLHHLGGAFAHAHRRHGKHPRRTMDQVRQRPPSVRENDLASRVRAQRVAHNQTHRRSPRLMRIIEHRLRQRRMDQSRIDWMRRVHKHHRFTLAQLCPNRPERLVP